ncbi:MAG: hypothetical protein UR12_C0016G0015 [candidate division TM6 bacterium GW2011_GWF2_30_66]|nr:MAG: hypothetical protein UR12_C0016G0015 [candidate division TM6 bacterium GW2011_GWF2_30_66]
MPGFGRAFSSMKADRKLTKEELIREIRFMISSEYEAVQLYTQLAESIDDQVAKAVLLDVAKEEIVHAGEFLKLLIYLYPEEEKLYQDGAKEVNEMIEKFGKK